MTGIEGLFSRSLWAVVAATAIFSTTGCGMSEAPYEKTGPADTQKAATRLTELPTLEDTETQLRAAVVELGAYASSLVPGLTWQWVDDRSLESCDRPYDQTKGSKVRLRNYVSSPALPDTVWPQILDRARQLAAPFGATRSEVFADKPGNHTVRLYSQESTAIFVGTQGAVISSNTGCRLPAARPPHLFGLGRHPPRNRPGARLTLRPSRGRALGGTLSGSQRTNDTTESCCVAS